ncbi:MAG: transcription antitermination factor NusB [Oscillospiraceae bacterium]|nr:transcription antitermination factor NusB [Oscillospiraceae bacterium]
MTRRKMRENIFILIFSSFFSDGGTDELLQQAGDCEFITLSEEVVSIFTDIIKIKNELDEQIRPHLKKWTIARISRVSLAVLRLAIYELLKFTEIDKPIIINEAVELMKKYSTQEDAAFVNGVLGSFIKKDDRNE